MSIYLTPFARTRLFPRTPRANTIQDCSAEEFEQHLNTHAADKVLDGLEKFKGKGKVIQTSLNKDEEAGLRAFLEEQPS